jgi:hypothetical protein
MPTLVEYTSAGSYTWQAPAGVTSVNITLIGAGADGGNTGSGNGGGGGAFIYKTGVPVTPGNNYAIVVGAHARPDGADTTWEATIFIAGGGHGFNGGTVSGSGTPTTSFAGGTGGGGCDGTGAVCDNCTCDTTCDNPPDCTSFSCNGNYNCTSSHNVSCSASGGGGSSGTISGSTNGSGANCGDGNCDSCGFCGQSCSGGLGGIAPDSLGGNGGDGGGNANGYGGGGGGFALGTGGYLSILYATIYDETGSGGVVVDGAAVDRVTRIYNETGSGGVVVDSTAVVRVRHFDIASGGVLVDGSATSNVGLWGMGGVVVGGADVNSLTYSQSGSGGVVVAGAAIVPFFYTDVGSGGVLADSTAYVSLMQSTTGSGGLLADGSDVDSTQILTSGGVLVDGINGSPAIYTITACGGVVLSNEHSGGGSLVSGSANLSPHNEIARGGVVIGTTFPNQEYYSSIGGVLVGGTSPIIFYNGLVGTDGAVASGEADVNQRHYARYEASGTVIVDGTFEGGITSRHFNATGQVETSGTAIVNFVFEQNYTYLWRTRAFIRKTLTFLWNTGRLPAYWYRILAKDKCSHDPCCQRYILNVHARSLTELCSKLSQRRSRFTIESVQKFSVPAETSVINQQEAAGQNLKCDTFEDVDVCQLAECAEFCVQFDVVEQIKADITKLQVNAFFDQITEGSIFVTGNADVAQVRFLPAFTHVAKGHVFVSGRPTVISSGYSFEADGDVKLSGEAGVRASHWAFVGGQWPNTTGIRLGNTAISSPTQITDQPWSLVERVFADDNLFSSTDISFAKSSAFLYVQGFNLQVPEDSEIIEIHIVVNRKVTRIGVQDLAVYLTVDNEPVSDNEAMIGIDWPLFADTEVEYVFTGPWDIDTVNAANFGFGIRVFATVPFTATIALIDYISAEVIYEDPEHQVVRVSGEPDIVSSGWSWSADDGIITMGSNAKVRLSLKYTPTGSINVVGQYGLDLNYQSSGTVVMGGNADCRPSFYAIVANGGIVAAAEALVVPYFEFGAGGTSLSGTATLTTQRSVTAQGGLGTGGFAFCPQIRFHYTAAGNAFVDGEAGRGKSVWLWTSSGAAIISGSAIQRPSDFGTLFETSNFGMAVNDLVITFGEDVELGNATGLGTIINRCDCVDLPLKVNLQHNLARNNNLSQFLTRNGLRIAQQLELSYNSINDSWQNNQHFRGISPNSNTRETWDILFELQCTQDTGSLFIGRKIWRLALEVTRRNLSTNEDFDTRLLIGILPEQVCHNNELKFKVSFDTQTEATQVAPASTIYQTVFFDNIGLFRTTSWLNDPDMVITVSQGGLSTTRRTVNLKDQVLVS